MTPEQLDALRLARGEYAALRTTVRRELADLWDLALDVTEAATAGRDGVNDDPAPAALSYAHYNLKLADRALTTVLETLRPLLDDEEAR